MATKTITITTDAYQILSSRKHEHESFSDVIKKMGTSGNKALLKLVGLLSPEQVGHMQKVIAEGRALSRERMDRVIKVFK